MVNTILYTDQKTQAQRIKLHKAMNLDFNECSLSLFSLLLSCLINEFSFLPGEKASGPKYSGC